MYRATNDLSLMLAPYLHGKRYSSYGRHFSRTPVLQAITNVLVHNLRPNDVRASLNKDWPAVLPSHMLLTSAVATTMHECRMLLCSSSGLDA